MKTHVIAVLTACSVGSVWAHGGEDHDHDAPAATPAVQGLAPRASAQTEQFELVAELKGAQGGAEPASAATLILYVDRFATNQPVEGATVEVESGAFKGVAAAQGAGVYRLPAQALAQPGRHPLTITVQTEEGADLLDATLVVSGAGADAPASGATIERYAKWLGRLAALVVALGVAGALLRKGLSVWRQRAPSSNNEAQS